MITYEIGGYEMIDYEMSDDELTEYDSSTLDDFSTPSRRGSTGSSPLTDPVVQNYRSGFLRCDSPRRPKVV
jgi:hypothetical protein